MKKLLTVLFGLSTFIVFGQNNPTEKAQPIVAEGKLLYKTEMASWYGTDLMLENYNNRENIGGYFSYNEGDTTKCIFFSNAQSPAVIGTIAFDTTYNVNTAKIDLNERAFTQFEVDLYEIRQIAIQELNTNADDFFEFYENTNPNIIPLINNKEKKVYILTAPFKSGVVILGNDYLLTFDKNNKLLTKKQLHNNIITFNYGDVEEDSEIVGTVHTHLPETGDFITATDICTLMLYAKFNQWESHNVVSKEYLNIWNCETNTLVVVPMNTLEKISKDQEKRKKKKEKE